MKTLIHTHDPIAIDRPMVLLPAEEYEELLREAGHLSTPVLDKEIADAREHFAKEKVIEWENLKDELL